MSAGDTEIRYGAATRVLHWLLFVLIAAQFTLALVFTWASGGITGLALSLHQALGVVILVVGAVFAAWRLANPKPTLAVLPAWQRGLARVIHLLLYIVIIAQPLFGLVMDMAKGYAIPFFGLFNIPPLIPESQAVGQVFVTLHIYTGWWVILLALAIHLIGTLYHQYVSHDRVLRRIWRGSALND